jgi:CHAT domain-containing protein
VVPHGVLHHVPFHALYDGSEHLIDRHDVVYGASAAVIRLCRERRRPPGTVRDLVLAVPDQAAPSLAEEAQVLGALLPQADVFVGEEATAAVLARYGGAAGRVHIAAHGVFRGDNPLFSSLRLGDTWLNLVDVFNLSLGSDLTTLSACETGLSSVIGGDELFGLSQGFLYAGTPSLVVSLWRVNDPTTTVFMRRFYEGLLRGEGKAAALRQAALDVKREHPHPYYWAPFILMGRS